MHRAGHPESRFVPGARARAHARVLVRAHVRNAVNRSELKFTSAWKITRAIEHALALTSANVTMRVRACDNAALCCRLGSPGTSCACAIDDRSCWPVVSGDGRALTAHRAIRRTSLWAGSSGHFVSPVRCELFAVRKQKPLGPLQRAVTNSRRIIGLIDGETEPGPARQCDLPCGICLLFRSGRCRSDQFDAFRIESV